MDCEQLSRDEAWLRRLQKASPEVYGEATLETDLFQLALTKGLYSSIPGREADRKRLVEIKEALKKKSQREGKERTKNEPRENQERTATPLTNEHVK
jgi:hypothetical protein